MVCVGNSLCSDISVVQRLHITNAMLLIKVRWLRLGRGHGQGQGWS